MSQLRFPLAASGRLKTVLICEAIRRIDGWLTNGPVFCPQSGAVAGVTNDAGVVFWYGEIAGYYLAYLTNLMKESTKSQSFANQAARLVGRWLETQWRSKPGPTRLYATTQVDWRNDHVFAFDLAMILRGLTSARLSGINVWDGRPIAGFIKTKLMDTHGSLRAIDTTTSKKPPVTWSTSVDGHLLKAAVGLKAWGSHFGDHTMFRLGDRTQKNLSSDLTSGWPHLPLHPRLYALEGLLICGSVSPATIAVLIQGIMAHINIETERTDVIAQLLRLSLFAQLEDVLVDELASRLLESIDADGSVVFRLNQADGQRNTWCAIFARQALHFYSEASNGRTLKHGLCI